jgi:hypothetical protein
MQPCDTSPQLDPSFVEPARLIQNLRRFLGSDLQYFAAIEPKRERRATGQRPRRSRSNGTGEPARRHA